MQKKVSWKNLGVKIAIINKNKPSDNKSLTIQENIQDNNSRPRNIIEKQFNKFIKKHLHKIFKIPPNQWFLHPFGYHEGLLNLIKQNYIHLTLHNIYPQIIYILNNWKKSKTCILDYKDCFKLPLKNNIQINILQLWLFKVFSNKYNYTKPQIWHHHSANIIQNNYRRYYTINKYNVKKLLHELNLVFDNLQIDTKLTKAQIIISRFWRKKSKLDKIFWRNKYLQSIKDIQKQQKIISSNTYNYKFKLKQYHRKFINLEQQYNDNLILKNKYKQLLQQKQQEVLYLKQQIQLKEEPITSCFNIKPKLDKNTENRINNLNDYIKTMNKKYKLKHRKPDGVVYFNNKKYVIDCSSQTSSYLIYKLSDLYANNKSANWKKELGNVNGSVTFIGQFLTPEDLIKALSFLDTRN